MDLFVCVYGIGNVWEAGICTDVGGTPCYLLALKVVCGVQGMIMKIAVLVGGVYFGVYQESVLTPYISVVLWDI